MANETWGVGLQKVSLRELRLRFSSAADGLSVWSVLLSQFYKYDGKKGEVVDDRFSNRLCWNGSKETKDLQDGSIYITNVTLEDKGTYMCEFIRTLTYSNFEYETKDNKTFVLNVVQRRKSTTDRQALCFVRIYNSYELKTCNLFFKIICFCSLLPKRFIWLFLGRDKKYFSIIFFLLISNSFIYSNYQNENVYSLNILYNYNYFLPKKKTWRDSRVKDWERKIQM